LKKTPKNIKQLKKEKGEIDNIMNDIKRLLGENDVDMDAVETEIFSMIKFMKRLKERRHNDLLSEYYEYLSEISQIIGKNKWFEIFGT